MEINLEGSSHKGGEESEFASMTDGDTAKLRRWGGEE